MSATPRNYEFGSAAEDRSVVLGLRAGQVGVIAAAAVVAVLVLHAYGGPGGMLAAAALVGGAASLVFWPIAGRTAEQWLPTLARWAAVWVLRRRRELSDAPLLGHDPAGRAAQRPPRTLTGVRLLAAPLDTGGRYVGVAHDRRAGTYTLALAVRGRSFQLADTPEKQRRLQSWGAILAGLARASSPVDRIQWVERTIPEDGDAMTGYLDRAAAAACDHPAVDSYRQLVEHAGPSTPRHQSLLVISVCERRARGMIRQAGGGPTGAVRVSVREARSLQRQLGSAEVTVDGILTPGLLAEAVRSSFDPYERSRPGHLRPDGSDGAASELAAAWPLAGETSWAAYRVGRAWHATYWVAQWPRTPVGADFLVPLLLGTSGVRTVALTMAPVSPLRAHREVERALLKQHADEELRHRAGFMGSARRRRTQQTLARREEELADGHADYRVSGYVTVTAERPDELDVACGEIEQAANQARLDLLRLNGQQDVAFTYTLPLARGLT